MSDATRAARCKVNHTLVQGLGFSLTLNPEPKLGFKHLRPYSNRQQTCIPPLFSSDSWSAQTTVSLLHYLILLSCCPCTLQVSAHPTGILVGVLSTIIAGLYQVWTGTKQAALAVNGNQLLQQVSPAAAALLAVLVPMFEPLGLEHLFGTSVTSASATGVTAAGMLATGISGVTALDTIPAPGLTGVTGVTAGAYEDTLVGYPYTPAAVAAILLSCLLGLSVTLSSYWAIGVTSPLTFNVVGHAKTVIILAGGVLLFHDVINLAKGMGLLLALAGVVMYSC